MSPQGTVSHRALLQDTEGREVLGEVLSTRGAAAHHKDYSESWGRGESWCGPGRPVLSLQESGQKGPRKHQPHSIILTFGPDGHQLDSFAGYEIQGLVDVGDLVHSHLAPLWLGQAFA